MSLAARDWLGQSWSLRHRRVARGSILFTVSARGSYRLQIGVNFSGVAAAPLLSPSCRPRGEGLELALFPYHQLVYDCSFHAELLLTSSQHNTDRVLCRVSVFPLLALAYVHRTLANSVKCLPCGDNSVVAVQRC